MLSKKMMGVALLAVAAVSSSAYAGDRDFNTVAGAVVGAAIGNSAGGRDGAIVGGLVGAAVGNSIRTDDRYYRGRDRGVETRVYTQPAPVITSVRLRCTTHRQCATTNRRHAWSTLNRPALTIAKNDGSVITTITIAGIVNLPKP
jgi:outer membrane lipoprotein SlyB